MNNFKNRHYNKKPDWLKWTFIGISVIIILLLIYAIYLYQTIETSKEKGFNNTEEKVLQETDLIKINTIDSFQAESLYHIISGETKDKEQTLVFMPVKDENDRVIVKKSDIISKEDIQSKWSKECNQCTLIKIMPAINEDKPLWEIAYVDRSNRYVLDYVSIYDGSSYEQLQFKQMFN